MLFDCANINSLLMKTISTESSGVSFPKSDDMSLETGAFAAKLSALIQGNNEKTSFPLPGGISEKSIMNKLSEFLKNKKLLSESPAEINNVLNSSDRENRTTLLGRLKALLLSVSNQDLKSLTINSKGLNALKALLIDAGFDAKMVNELMVDLHEMLQESELTLSECFEKLSELVGQDGVPNNIIDEENESENDNLMALSALPFIETLLTALKLSPEKINTVLSEATQPKKGIDLDILIEKLHQIQKTAFLSNQSIKTTDSESGFQMLLTQLGLEPSDVGSSELTLDDLIQAFERLRLEIKQQHTAGVKSELHPAAVNKDIAQALAAGRATDRPIYDHNGPGALKSSSHQTQKDQILATLFENIEIKEPKGIQVKENIDTLKTAARADAVIHHMESKLKQETSANTPLLGKAEDQSAYKTLFSKIQALSKGQETDSNAIGKELAAKDYDSLSAKTSKIQKLSSDIGQLSSAEIKTSDALSDVKETAGKPIVRNLSDYVAHQVKQSLVRAINQGTSELKIQLKPPELGRLMITIENTGNNMKVNIVAENQSTRDILLSNINELKTVFTNSGLNLENFEVDLTSNFKQSMADARSQADQFGDHHPGRKPGSGRTDDEGNLQIKENMTNASSIFTGRLHYVA